MKLVEILAREWKEWPCSDNSSINTTESGMLWDSEGKTHGQYFYSGEFEYERVTRAQWEAERARIAGINEQYTFHPGEAIMPPPFDSSRYEQELWDKVAQSTMASMVGAIGGVDFFVDDACRHKAVTSADFASCAADYAGAFMAERDKRLKWGGK